MRLGTTLRGSTPATQKSRISRFESETRAASSTLSVLMISAIVFVVLRCRNPRTDESP